jgi:hypothetical protein
MRNEAITCALMLILTSQAASAQDPDDAPRSRWWGGIGIGYGRVDASAEPGPSGEGGVWIELQGGFRLGEHWLLGLELSGTGVEISQANYDPADRNSTVYGQSISSALALVQYVPWANRGWLFTAGAGEMYYDNARLRAVTHQDTSGTGNAALIRASYDWPGHYGRHGIDLSYERGHVNLEFPFDGRFDVSMFAVGIHYTFR